MYLNIRDCNPRVLSSLNSAPCGLTYEIEWGPDVPVIGDMSYFGDMSPCRRDETGHIDPYPRGGLMSCHVVTMTT
eukprot:scaffold9929_cov22-Cyclotella_meneghiniana.AAC.1